VKVIEVVAAVAAHVPLVIASVPFPDPLLLAAPAEIGIESARHSRTVAEATVLRVPWR
jgi:hypothetical protein